jgi:hypothetical protein
LVVQLKKRRSQDRFSSQLQQSERWKNPNAQKRLAGNKIGPLRQNPARTTATMSQIEQSNPGIPRIICLGSDGCQIRDPITAKRYPLLGGAGFAGRSAERPARRDGNARR